MYEKEKFYKIKFKNVNVMRRVELEKKIVYENTILKNIWKFWIQTQIRIAVIQICMIFFFTLYKECCNNKYNKQKESNNNVLSLDEYVSWFWSE